MLQLRPEMFYNKNIENVLHSTIAIESGCSSERSKESVKLRSSKLLHSGFSYVLTPYERSMNFLIPMYRNLRIDFEKSN